MRRGLDHALDEYLVLLAQGGSREAFARLEARWSPKLLAFAARTFGGAEEARDVVQESWESAVRGLRRLEDPARFPAWIYAIAARKCADVLRARYRGARIREAALARINDHAIDAEDEAVDRMDVAAALKRLPPEQRVAVSLFFGEGMSIADISRITGAAPGTVKSRLFAARRSMRASLGEVE